MMDIISRNIPVRMVRCNLEGIPAYPVPEGYALRWYRPGDEELWVAVQTAAEKHNVINLDFFHREFGDCVETLADRQLFLFDPTCAVVGTVTAWFDNDYHGEKYGRIHWLAIVPAQQGRGLSKPLLSCACLRLRVLGHDKAYLVTSTARIRAINLYLSFGFVPEIRSAEDGAIWEQMARHLKTS